MKQLSLILLLAGVTAVDAGTASSPAECTVAACACREICALPLNPRMRDDDAAAVAAAVRGAND